MNLFRRERDVHLPVGYQDAAGRWHRRAVIRKMSGYEEALLHDAELSAGRLVTLIIQACLVKLGDLDNVDAGVVRRLYSADRNSLLVAIRRFTLGDRLRAWYRCPSCGKAFAVDEDLSRLDVRCAGEGCSLELTVVIEDGYLDGDGQLHREVVLTLPRGVDEELVSRWIGADPVAAQDALLLSCVRRFGTLPRATFEARGSQVLRDLTLGDRLLLQRVVAERLPGVSFQRALVCGDCHRSFEAALDVSNFFAPA